MTSPNVKSSLSNITEQVVAIVGVDVPANTAVGLTRQRSHIPIDTRYLVGTVHVVPVVGEQWYVKRLGMSWALDRKLPFNTDTLATVAENPVEGQVQIGSSGVGQGPLQLHGSSVNVNAPLQFQATATTDLPDASSLSPGSAIWDVAQNKLVISDGTDWRDTGGVIVLGSRAPVMAGTGTLHVTLLVRPYLSARLAGNGRITVRAEHGAGRLAFLSGRGRLTTALKIGKRVILSGRGVLSAAARMYRIARPAALAGHGTMSAGTFLPFTETNINRTGQGIPTGASGCYVTLDGAGGGGGGGRDVSAFGSGTGGGGGGGGAKIFRVFIPRASLGTTFSVSSPSTGGGGGTTPGGSGTNGSAGSAGGAATFTSGSVTLVAGGGAGGGGGTGSGTALGGSGGTTSVSGASPTTANGTAGGNSTNGSNASAGTNNAAGAGAGGGGGGGYSYPSGHTGGKGGNSTTVTGPAGASGTGATAGDAAAGLGGAGGGGAGGSLTAYNGGGGGDFGGGGGGAGASYSDSATAGAGGRGYSLVEWT